MQKKRMPMSIPHMKYYAWIHPILSIWLLIVAASLFIHWNLFLTLFLATATLLTCKYSKDMQTSSDEDDTQGVGVLAIALSFISAITLLPAVNTPHVDTVTFPTKEEAQAIHTCLTLFFLVLFYSVYALFVRTNKKGEVGMATISFAIESLTTKVTDAFSSVETKLKADVDKWDKDKEHWD